MSDVPSTARRLMIRLALSQTHLRVVTGTRLWTKLIQDRQRNE